MKFCPLKTAAGEPSALAAEYRSARKTDVFRLGERHLFFRKRMTVYYVSYDEIDRFFRRVLMVPVRVSCCGGEMAVGDHLALEGRANSRIYTKEVDGQLQERTAFEVSVMSLADGDTYGE